MRFNRDSLLGCTCLDICTQAGLIERCRQGSPQSPTGLSPSRSRSVWPSYPRIHPALPHRPATPLPGSHSETTSTTSLLKLTQTNVSQHWVWRDFKCVCTCNMSTTVFTMFHWDFRPSTITVKPRALHFSLREKRKMSSFYENTNQHLQAVWTTPITPVKTFLLCVNSVGFQFLRVGEWVH